MITHAVLQKLPPEALGDDDRHGVVEVLTVGSREEMERFLAGPPTALAAGNERKLATSRLRGTSGNWPPTPHARGSQISHKSTASCPARAKPSSKPPMPANNPATFIEVFQAYRGDGANLRPDIATQVAFCQAMFTICSRDMHMKNKCGAIRLKS
jgi:hypothetical protein